MAPTSLRLLRARAGWLAVFVLLAAACGTRLDEQAVRDAQAQTTERVVSESGSSVAGATSAPTGTTGRFGNRVDPVVGAAPTVEQDDRTGVAGGVIKVGGIFPLSGGLSALGRPVEQAARAYFRHVNDTGGVNGRRIEFIAEDDAADPNRTRSAAEKLVNQDKVFVMGPSFTPFSPDLVGFLQNRGVPFVGFDGNTVDGFKSSTTISMGASIPPHAEVLVPYWYAKTKAQRIGVVYLDVPPAREYLQHTKNVVCPKIGCQVVREQPIQFTTTDYTSILLGMRSANVDGVFIVTDPASAVKLLLQARAQNYTPSPGGYLGQHGIYLDLVPESCGSFCDGIMAPTSLFPPTVPNAATNEMRKVVGTYYQDVEYGYFTELGYASARLLVDLIRRTGADLERASLLATARSLTSYDTGGFTNPKRPLDLTPGIEHPRDMIIVRMSGGKWLQESGWLPPGNF
jgi:branched-chain amino acid transport system substrate-binding protein